MQILGKTRKFKVCDCCGCKTNHTVEVLDDSGLTHHFSMFCAPGALHITRQAVNRKLHMVLNELIRKMITDLQNSSDYKTFISEQEKLEGKRITQQERIVIDQLRHNLSKRKLALREKYDIELYES